MCSATNWLTCSTPIDGAAATRGIYNAAAAGVRRNSSPLARAGHHFTGTAAGLRISGAQGCLHAGVTALSSAVGCCPPGFLPPDAIGIILGFRVWKASLEVAGIRKVLTIRREPRFHPFCIISEPLARSLNHHWLQAVVTSGYSPLAAETVNKSIAGVTSSFDSPLNQPEQGQQQIDTLIPMKGHHQPAQCRKSTGCGAAWRPP